VLLAATLRLKARLRHYTKIPARVMKIRLDGEEVLINPLLGIEWNFDHFFDFAHKVADVASEHLQRRR
jgi:hypothetical protein